MEFHYTVERLTDLLEAPTPPLTDREQLLVDDLLALHDERATLLDLLVDALDEADLTERLRRRLAADNGVRHSLAEAAARLGIDLDAL